MNSDVFRGDDGFQQMKKVQYDHNKILVEFQCEKTKMENIS
jgi:hypothetical protein